MEEFKILGETIKKCENSQIVSSSYCKSLGQPLAKGIYRRLGRLAHKAWLIY